MTGWRLNSKRLWTSWWMMKTARRAYGRTRRASIRNHGWTVTLNSAIVVRVDGQTKETSKSIIISVACWRRTGWNGTKRKRSPSRRKPWTELSASSSPNCSRRRRSWSANAVSSNRLRRPTLPAPPPDPPRRAERCSDSSTRSPSSAPRRRSKKNSFRFLPTTFSLHTVFNLIQLNSNFLLLLGHEGKRASPVWKHAQLARR